MVPRLMSLPILFAARLRVVQTLVSNIFLYSCQGIEVFVVYGVMSALFQPQNMEMTRSLATP